MWIFKIVDGAGRIGITAQSDEMADSWERLQRSFIWKKQIWFLQDRGQIATIKKHFVQCFK